MRYILAILMAFVIESSVFADDYKFLTFEKASGSTENITAVGTVITFNDGMLKAVNGTENHVISLKDLTKMYFSNNSSFLMGDVNNDGEISVADVTLLVSYILGDLQTDEEGLKLVEERGDVDSSGQISIADVSILVEMILVS